MLSSSIVILVNCCTVQCAIYVAYLYIMGRGGGYLLIGSLTPLCKFRPNLNPLLFITTLFSKYFSSFTLIKVVL